MPSFEELVKRKIELLHSSPEALASESERVQRQIWRELEPLVNEFDVDSNGRIAQTEANIRRIAKVTDALKELLAGQDYIDAIKTFLKDIDEGVQITDDLAREISKTFEPDKIQKQILEITKANAINGLIGDSMVSRVTQPFIDQLTTSIATKATFKDVVKALRVTIEGDKEVDGRILANVKVIAQTAQSISDRSYSAAVNEAVGAEWYLYRGGEIPTTRKFCEERNGQYFHKKEIEKWGEMNWDGRIESTNSKTIFSYAGGWNCRHSIIAVSMSRVPKSVVERNIAEGNYKP